MNRNAVSWGWDGMQGHSFLNIPSVLTETGTAQNDLELRGKSFRERASILKPGEEL
jgi:hypothetical protein